MVESCLSTCLNTLSASKVLLLVTGNSGSPLNQAFFGNVGCSGGGPIRLQIRFRYCAAPLCACLTQFLLRVRLIKSISFVLFSVSCSWKPLTASLYSERARWRAVAIAPARPLPTCSSNISYSTAYRQSTTITHACSMAHCMDAWLSREPQLCVQHASLLLYAAPPPLPAVHPASVFEPFKTDQIRSDQISPLHPAQQPGGV